MEPYAVDETPGTERNPYRVVFGCADESLIHASVLQENDVVAAATNEFHRIRGVQMLGEAVAAARENVDVKYDAFRAGYLREHRV